MSKITKISNAAVIVMASIVLSRLTGFFREMLVPNILGTNAVGDAYNIAFRITGLMYDLLVGGAIAAALIPILSGYLAKDEESEGWKAVGTFMNVVVICMLIFCTLGIIFAPQLVNIMAVGFHQRKQVDLTIQLVRILFPSVAFLMLAGLLNGVLNSYQRFISSAFGPTLYNIGCALSLFFIGRSTFGAKGVAYGIVASSFTYFLLQLICSWKNLSKYKPIIYLKNEGFKKLIKLAIPSLAASSVVQLNVIITGSFVSLFDAGSVTAYNVADRTWQMPFGIFAQGIGIAILPSLSAMFAKEDFTSYKAVLNRSLRSVLAIILPCATIFLVLDEPIIRAVFKFTDKFHEDAILLTGNILMFFAFAMISQSMVSILMRAFYSANNTKIPFYTGAVSVVLIFILSYIFYKFTNLGASGMALAYSIASFVNAVAMLILLNNKVCKLDFESLGKFVSKVCISSIFMGIVLYYCKSYISVSHLGKIQQLLIIVLESFAGLGIFALGAYLLKIDEVFYAFRRFLPKKRVDI